MWSLKENVHDWSCFVQRRHGDSCGKRAWKRPKQCHDLCKIYLSWINRMIFIFNGKLFQCERELELFSFGFRELTAEVIMVMMPQGYLYWIKRYQRHLAIIASRIHSICMYHILYSFNSISKGPKMKFVFWCSNEQRQFRLAELDAIIHMLGLQVSVTNILQCSFVDICTSCCSILFLWR